VAATFGLTAGGLNRATAQLNHTPQQMKQARAKEMRVARQHDTPATLIRPPHATG
jgi:hypothetical protein